VQREVEDLEALIGDNGGREHLSGISSGALLAMEAARHGATIDRLAVNEPPFIVDDSRPPAPSTYRPELNELLAAGRRGAVSVPTLVLVGGKSPEWMANGMSLAAVLPSARREVLDGQTHIVKPKVLAPALKGFFASA
jgi:hypothetical protein